MSCPTQSLEEGAYSKAIMAVQVSNGRKAEQRDLLLVHRCVLGDFNPGISEGAVS